MQKRTGWTLLGASVVGPIIGFLMACVVTYVMPTKYESEAVIEVDQSRSASGSTAMTPLIFGSDFEMLRSSKTLGKVVDRLGLANRWAVDKNTAIRILKGMMYNQNIHGTDLISIRVRDTDKEEARNIAAEVVLAYQIVRDAAIVEEEQRRDLALRRVIRDQEDLTDEHRKAVKRFSAQGPAEFYDESQINLSRAEMDLENLRLKLLEETIHKKERQKNIIVHEEPQIADAPISPNVLLNLSLGASLGFLLFQLIAWLVVAAVNHRSPQQTSFDD
ncbi:MAG: hypothetical protein ABIS50_10115 [Luteolibacter sp.]|uniref:hypothetical protein n=1 Tax=Luteolibacter sp. TaxID=1962973 RepID=UPI003263BB29